MHWNDFDAEAWDAHIRKLPLSEQLREIERLFQEAREWLEQVGKEIEF